MIIGGPGIVDPWSTIPGPPMITILNFYMSEKILSNGRIQQYSAIRNADLIRGSAPNLVVGGKGDS